MACTSAPMLERSYYVLFLSYYLFCCFFNQRFRYLFTLSIFSFIFSLSLFPKFLPLTFASHCLFHAFSSIFCGKNIQDVSTNTSPGNWKGRMDRPDGAAIHGGEFPGSQEQSADGRHRLQSAVFAQIPFLSFVKCHQHLTITRFHGNFPETYHRRADEPRPSTSSPRDSERKPDASCPPE